MSTTYTPSAILGISLNVTEKVAQALNSFSIVLQSGVGAMPVLDHNFANGAAAGQINKVFWNQYTSTQTLTLSSLTDPAGQSIAFTTIWAIIIQVAVPTAGTHLTVGNAAVDPIQLWFSGTTVTEDVRDLSIHISQVDGWAVASGSADQLKITVASGTPTFNVIILGQ